MNSLDAQTLDDVKSLWPNKADLNFKQAFAFCGSGTGKNWEVQQHVHQRGEGVKWIENSY